MYKQFISLTIATGILIPNVVLAEQTVIQRGSTSATAVGHNNRIQSKVNQSATQSQNSFNYLYGNQQTSIQQGESNGVGVGNDNSVTNRVHQHSTQTQAGRDFDNQNSEQNATSRGEATGDRNRINHTNRQHNRQNRWSY